MAAVTQCDRCGAYFKSNSHKNNMVAIGKRGRGTIVVSDRNTYDLCQNCINKLEKFIEQSEDKNEMET